MDIPWRDAVEAALQDRREKSALRSRKILQPLDATHVDWAGRRLINFASNDYLGLTHHPQVIQAQRESAARDGAGSGAAALVSGYTPTHASAEQAIAHWKGTQSSILLSSGYAANLAAIQTIVAIAGDRPVQFLLDKLSHASLIDAVQGSGVRFRIFPHNHLPKLERLLRESDGMLSVVATESVFSMDGDAADLHGIAAIKQKHPFLWLLDEAHGSGVYGIHGSGYASECGLADEIDVTVATLSKALGVSGGVICASESFCQAVVNFGRSYIYSTNVPPAVAAGIEAAIGVVRAEPHRQARLREIAKYFRQKLRSAGYSVATTDSPIIPVIVGEASAALAAADALCDAGFFVPAIRPPTVAPGSSRLRITLSCEHTDEEIEGLLHALSKI